ncbi:MAG: putative metal-binding motif-containing protein [Myxococcota bacterium]
MWLFWSLACSGWKVVSDLDGDGYSIDEGDCDDSNIGVAPNKVEICDGLDNDCNGVIDDASGVNVPLFYPDFDGDGFGTVDGARLYCPDFAPENYVPAGLEDCDDGNPEIYPSAVEMCDGLDNDCDLRIDAEAQDQTVWYPDDDSDDFGAFDGVTISQCDQPPGHVDNGDDCDDSNPDINPLEAEVCDQVDNDCNGLIDDGVDQFPTYFLDADGDGFGGIEVEFEGCDEPPSGYVLLDGDCDDFDLTIFPGSRLGIEAPNSGFSVDINCDNLVACTDMGCNAIPDLWSSPMVGFSQLLQEDGQLAVLSGLSDVLLAEKVPLLDDNHARILALNGNACVSNWLTITMDINAPEVSSLGVSSVQAQQVLIQDIDADGVSDIVVISGFGADNAMNCPTNPNVQYYKMGLQSTGFGPDLWQVQQSADVVDIQGVSGDIVDIDGNGTLDLVLCSHQNDFAELETSQILYDAFSGASGQSLELGVTGCRSINTLDWDNDGALDVVMAGDNGQHVFLNSNNYAPEFLSSEASQLVMVMDGDANGQDDVLFVPHSETESNLFIYTNGNSSPQLLGVENCFNPTLNWINGDAFPELICTNAFESLTQIFWGSSQGFQAEQALTVSSGSHSFSTYGYWSNALVPSLIWAPSFGSTFACEYLTNDMQNTECTDAIQIGQSEIAPILLGPPVGPWQ